VGRGVSKGGFNRDFHGKMGIFEAKNGENGEKWVSKVPKMTKIDIKMAEII
jgi:hypothetical protein